MRKFPAIFVSLFLFAQLALPAQELTNAERRRINLKVLNVIELYERASKLSDDEERYIFRELFAESDSTRIFMDLMGMDNYMGQVSVKQYMDAVEANMIGIDVGLYNVRRGKMSFDGDVWKIPVSFMKRVSYFDNNGVLFSTDEFYKGAKYDYMMTLAYNPVEDMCRISSIDGNITSVIQFPSGRFYVMSKDPGMSAKELKRENKLFEQNNLKYNSFDQVFVSGSELEPWHRDIRIKREVIQPAGNYDIIKLKYNKLKWRGKIRYAHTYNNDKYGFGAFKAFSSNQDKITTRSNATEYGFDIGRAALVGRGGSLSIYTGAALSKSNVSFSKDDFEYRYSTVDPGNTANDYNDASVNYTRIYKIDEVKESVSYTDIVVPLYVSWDPSLGKWMHWSFSAGMKFYFNRDVEASSLDFKGKVTYGDKVSELGSYDRFLTTTRYCEPFSYSMAFGFEWDFAIPWCKRYAYIYAKASYEYGLSGYYHDAGNRRRFFSESDYPLVYSAVENKDIAVKSFLSSVDLRRQALWFELGLMFKF